MSKVMIVPIILLLGLSRAQSFPKDVSASKSGFEDRKRLLVEKWGIGGYLPSGTWEANGSRNLRKIAAGLDAIKNGYSFAPTGLTPSYPVQVENWLWDNVTKYARAGTDLGNHNGDYDLELTQIISLLYKFKDDPALLTNKAVQALVCQDKTHPACSVPYANQSLSEVRVSIDWSGYEVFSVKAELPETENHVLMIYAWKYLVNQWLRKNYRGASYVSYNASLHDNEGGNVEDLLLQALGRIVTNGYFESNARAYESLSLMPIFALYSFADSTTTGGRKIRTAAKNALDYTAVKFAFQSFESKRYAPARRHLEYANRAGIYENDYVPQIFGVLSGGYVADDAVNCSSNCFYWNDQSSGFSLWASLYAYRIPDAILDFHLRKDNHKAGFGAWSRMQSRYTQAHYKFDSDPVYLPGGVLNAPDLSSNTQIRAPEFYFMTEDYMHTSGGDYSHYSAFDITTLPVPYIYKEYDRFAKPSAFIGKGNIGFWPTIDDARNATMMMKGDEEDATLSAFGYYKNWWTSRNLGVYKNVVYGYSGKRHIYPDGLIWLNSASIWPMSFPTAWTGVEIPVGNWKLKIFALNTGNAFGNPDLGSYILATSINPAQGRNGYWGFWEVIPQSRFPGALGINDLITWFANTNAGFAAQTNQDINFITATGNEKLTFNLGYGVETFWSDIYGSNVIKKVDDDANLAKATFGDLDNQAGVKSFPLIEVRQVAADMHFTDTYYVQTDNAGWIIIRNPHLGKTIEIDGRDWRNPARKERSVGFLPSIYSLLLN